MMADLAGEHLTKEALVDVETLVDTDLQKEITVEHLVLELILDLVAVELVLLVVTRAAVLVEPVAAVELV